MTRLYIGYATFKQIAQANSLPVFERAIAADTRRVWCGAFNVVYECDVRPADFADYSAAFPSATSVAMDDEGVANAIGLEPMPVIMQPTFENTGGVHPIWRGHLYTAANGATNIFDELVTTERELRGGWYEIIDAPNRGDYIEFAVVDKDDVLGMFTPLGLTVGQDILELKKYVRQQHVNPKAEGQRRELLANSTFVIISGLYLRTIYESTGGTDIDFEVVTLAYE